MKGQGVSKRVVIAGAGMAGLTAAAYLSQYGYNITVFEKSGNYGGLVQSFERLGFHFDTGPRAIGNAGIIRPMAEDLGLNIRFTENGVSTGIAGHIVHYDSMDDISRYILSLEYLFPESLNEVRQLSARIHSYSRMMAALNRVANPYFKNPLKDLPYMFTELLPWLPAFASILVRTSLGKKNIEEELEGISSNRSLNDMVCQHFFKGTPREFALGYFFNFTDYLYPVGGTGELPEALRRKACANGVRIVLNTPVISVNPAAKTVIDITGTETGYDALLWAADSKTFYSICSTEGLPGRYRRAFERKKTFRLESAAAESVYSIFAAADLPPSYFSGISRGHFIYTPETRGLGDLHRSKLTGIKRNFGSVSKNELWKWLEEFCRYNSYEISIPALKDASLAPEGKTGLIISLLFDGELCRLITEKGWYKEFKERINACIIDTLSSSVYPGLDKHLLFTESASPCTLSRTFGNSEGSIVGWSLEGAVPAANHLAKTLSSVRTPLPAVFQAGQWSYSPAGVPIAVLTGRIAAAEIRRTT